MNARRNRETRRWYSSEGQAEISRRAAVTGSGRTASRRIVSLVVMLVFVIVAMRALQDPAQYEPAIRAVGLAHPAQPAQPAQPVPPADEVEATEAADVSPSRIAPIETLTASQLLSVATELERLKTAEEAEREKMLVAVFANESAADEGGAANVSSPDSAADETPAAGSVVDADRVAADVYLLRQLTDASVWRTAEQLPLSRALARAASWRQVLAAGEGRPPVIRLSVPLLTDAMDRVRGGIGTVTAAVQRIDDSAKQRSTPWGDFYYYTAWLRAKDNATTPLAVYMPVMTADAPPPLVAEPEEYLEWTLLPIKRLPYNAAVGIQIAPVLAAIDWRPAADRANATQREAAGTAIPNEMQPDEVLTLDPLAWGIGVWDDALVAAGPTESQRQKGREAAVQLYGRALTQLAQHAQTISTPQEEIPPAAAAAVLGVIDAAKKLPLDEEDARWLTERLSDQIDGLESIKSVDMRGEVRDWNRHPLPRGLGEAIGQSEIYSVPIVDDKNPSRRPDRRSVDVWARRIPGWWQQVPGKGLDVDGSASALEIVINGERLFLAEDVRWDASADDLDATWLPKPPQYLIELVRHGFDLNDAEKIAARQQGGITADEARPFYAFLRASAAAQAAEPLPLMEVLREPAASFGKGVAGRAVCVQVTRIDVPAADAATLGQDSYYSLDVLADIGSQTIRLTGGDGEPIEFHGEFPVTLLALDIPRELGGGEPDRRGSWRVSEELAWNGRFYRLWQYDSHQTASRQGQQILQTAPLVAASSLAVRDIRPVDGNFWRMPVIWSLVLVGSALAIAGVVIAVESIRKRKTT